MKPEPRLVAGLALALLGAVLQAQLLPSALDTKGAREVADQVARGVIAGDTASLFRQMETVYQQSTRPEAMRPTLEAVYSYGGRPLEAQFKAADSGSKFYADGTRKSLIKVWYAARTTKSKKGTYFLVVEVVPDGGRLACTTFSVVAFTNGIPEHLR